MLNLDRIKLNKRGYVVDPKHCLGCVFRYASGGSIYAFSCCTLYEHTGRVPEADRRGQCKRKIVGSHDGSKRWRREGAGGLKK